MAGPALEVLDVRRLDRHAEEVQLGCPRREAVEGLDQHVYALVEDEAAEEAEAEALAARPVPEPRDELRGRARRPVVAHRDAAGRDAVPDKHVAQVARRGEDALRLEELAGQVGVAVEVGADGQRVQVRADERRRLQALAAVPAPRRPRAERPVAPAELYLVAEEPVVVEHDDHRDAARPALRHQLGRQVEQVLDVDDVGAHAVEERADDGAGLGVVEAVEEAADGAEPAVGPRRRHPLDEDRLIVLELRPCAHVLAVRRPAQHAHDVPAPGEREGQIRAVDFRSRRVAWQELVHRLEDAEPAVARAGGRAEVRQGAGGLLRRLERLLERRRRHGRGGRRARGDDELVGRGFEPGEQLAGGGPVGKASAAEIVGDHGIGHLVRRAVPCVDRQSRRGEQLGDRVAGEEVLVGPVEDAERLGAERAEEQLETHGDVRDLRDRGDDEARLGHEERQGPFQHPVRLPQMLQHVREDDRVEAPAAQLLLPARLLDVALDDLLAMGPGAFGVPGVALDPDHPAPLRAQHLGEVAVGAADVEHEPVAPDQAGDLGDRRVLVREVGRQVGVLRHATSL